MYFASFFYICSHRYGTVLISIYQNDVFFLWFILWRVIFPFCCWCVLFYLIILPRHPTRLSTFLKFGFGCFDIGSTITHVFHSPHLWICNFSQVKSMWQQHFNLPAQNILHRGRRGFVTQEKWWPNGATRTNEIVDRGPNSVAQENWTTVNVEPCLSWGYLQTFLCYAFHSMPFIENITINAPSWLNNSVGTCMIIPLTGHILFGWSSHKTKTSFWKAETGYPTLLNSEPIETQFWGQEGVWKHAS